MMFNYRKNLLLLTTVLCGASALGANAAKAEDLDVLEILNASETKSPNISWALGSEGEANTVEILRKYYTYTWTQNDPTRGKYTTRQINTLSGNVNADFIGSYTVSGSGAYGGAVYNSGTIGDISGNFIGNYASSDSYVSGGAVENSGTINSFTGDFIGSYTVSGSGASGGAVYNSGTIGDISGNFIGNYASSDSYVSGGAVENSGTIDNISGNFIGNYTSSDPSFARGGAVSNYVTINSITGDFIGNYASSSNIYSAGGAIYNFEGTINSITGDFIGNHVTNSILAIGGAIAHLGMMSISGDFIDNYVSGSNSDTMVSAGAIGYWGIINFIADATNSDYEDDIKFKGNYVTTDGGTTKEYEAIVNGTVVGMGGSTLNLTANNKGSYTFYDYIKGISYIFDPDKGTVLLTPDIPSESVVNFLGDGTGMLNLYNHIKGQGAVNFENSYTINTTDGEIKKIEISNLNMKDGSTGSKLNLDVDLRDMGQSDYFNLTGTNTGAENLSLDTINILNDIDMEDDTYALKFDYASNVMTNASEHKVNTSGGVYTIRADGKTFSVYRESASGGYANFLEDIIKEGEDRNSYSFTKDEYMKRYFDHGNEGLWLDRENVDITIFGNKHTLSAETKAKSMALKLAEGQKASMSDLTISGFETGIETAGELALNGVTIKDSTTGLKLGANVELSGTNTFEGNIRDIESTGAYTLTLAEDAVLNLSSTVTGNITFAGSQDSLISLAESVTAEGADLLLNNPTLKVANEATNLKDVNSFEARSGSLDLQNDVVRALMSNNFSITGAINLLVDADLAAKKMDRFENAEISENGSILVTGIKILSDGAEELTQIDFADENYKEKVSTSVKEVLSTQYTYQVAYNEETGQFEFIREKELAPEEVIINQTPAVANAGAVMLTEAVSQRVLNADSIKAQGASSGDEFGLKAWVQTFGSRDDVELKHLSPTIDAKFYGVLGGIDSKTFAYDNGVKATYGVYGAYTRSEQKYAGNKIKQKGGYFGLKALFEKGGLFSKLTANMGFLNNEALTEWGKDKFDTKVISAATQTGYDFKLKPSKVPFNLRGEKPFYEMNMDITITPSLYVGYMGIDTDDYTSKAGTAIKNKFMNVVEIAPELKVANNFGNGLEGYLKGAYKMFIYDNDQVKVDTALLPSMSVKPYVEYGFGFEKTFSTAKAYGDIMRHDGGKEGFDFNLGIKLEF